eukprot:6360524-Pyramimonas_sp.AAC.1
MSQQSLVDPWCAAIRSSWSPLGAASPAFPHCLMLLLELTDGAADSQSMRVCGRGKDGEGRGEHMGTSRGAADIP